MSGLLLLLLCKIEASAPTISIARERSHPPITIKTIKANQKIVAPPTVTSLCLFFIEDIVWKFASISE